jgi:ribosome recycling factor
VKIFDRAGSSLVFALAESISVVFYIWA